MFHYLCEFNVGRISQYPAVGLLVASIANQLRVPHTEVVLPIRPLRKDCNGRPGKRTTERLTL